MDPNVKEKHKDSNKEKEEPEKLVIVSRITRLPAWYELTKINQAK